MNRAAGLLLIVAFATSSAAAQTAGSLLPSTVGQSNDGAWQTIFNSQTQFTSYSTSGGGSTGPGATSNSGNGVTPGVGGGGGGVGSQIYTSYAGQLIGRPSDDSKVEFLIRSGYIWSKQSNFFGSASVGSPTDTTLGSRFTYYGLAGIQPFVAVNLNLPTGSTIVNGTSSSTRMDSNLVQTPMFGEGFNIAPTIGASIPFTESLILTGAVGYTNRGVYSRSDSFYPITLASSVAGYKPGDVLTGNLALGWRGDYATLQVSASYSVESKSLVNGLAYYRAGDRMLLSAKGGYAWSDAWSSRLSLGYAHSNKIWNAVAGMPDLAQERANSNGDIYNASFDTTYNAGGLSIGPNVGALYRRANSYAQTDTSFVPTQIGWTTGASAQYALSQMISLSAGVTRLWVKQNGKPNQVDVSNALLTGTIIPSGGTTATFTNGWTGTLAAVIRF